MKRPWYLHGLFIFFVGNFTCGIGWVVLLILRINWDKQNNKNFFETLVKNNGDPFTRTIMQVITKFRAEFISSGGLILVHRYFTSEGYPSKFMVVSLRGNIENLDLEKAKQEGYEIKTLEDNRVEISKIIKGYNISQTKLEQYIKYIGSILKEQYQDNGNDIVDIKKDIIAIMPDIKNVVLMTQNR